MEIMSGESVAVALLTLEDTCNFKPVDISKRALEIAGLLLI